MNKQTVVLTCNVIKIQKVFIIYVYHLPIFIYKYLQSHIVFTQLKFNEIFKIEMIILMFKFESGYIIWGLHLYIILSPEGHWLLYYFLGQGTFVCLYVGGLVCHTQKFT